MIELAVPSLLTKLSPRVTEIALLAGEAPDHAWLSALRKNASDIPVTCAIEPALGYYSEQRATPQILARRIRAHLERSFDSADPASCLVWAHNQGLGRNLLLTQALNQACAERNLPLLLHHHDWWFDNRWPRWPELRRSGFRTLSAVARTLFPPLANVRHAAINRADATVLQRHLGCAAAWLPNPARLDPAVAPTRLRPARRWLDLKLGERAPVWLVPCRLLRRKNLAEACLLTRWLRPEAWLVTTGGASSAAEQWYAKTLMSAARREGWRLRLGILHRDESGPLVPELMAVSEVVLLTSVQEGFGLPYVEAAAAHRPLIARSLPNVAPDLEELGFRLAQCYDEIWVDPDLFDWKNERRRQTGLFKHWRSTMPSNCQRQVSPPSILTGSRIPKAVPFSRLTLNAQLEVLRQPVERSWELCAPLNPFLETWRERAARGTLLPTPWPREASRWLAGRAYASRLVALMGNKVTAPPKSVSERCHRDLLASKLQPQFLYPLLWSSET